MVYVGKHCNTADKCCIMVESIVRVAKSIKNFFLQVSLFWMLNTPA